MEESILSSAWPPKGYSGCSFRISKSDFIGIVVILLMAEIMLLECFKCCQAYYFFWWRILPARLWFGALSRQVTLTTRRTVCFVRESFWTFTLHCWWAPRIWHQMTLFVKFSIWIFFRGSVVKFQWLFSFVVRGFEMFDTSHGWRSRNIPQNHRKSLAIRF